MTCQVSEVLLRGDMLLQSVAVARYSSIENL